MLFTYLDQPMVKVFCQASWGLIKATLNLNVGPSALSLCHSRCLSQRLVKFWFGKEVKGLEGKSKAGRVALYFLRLLLTNSLFWKNRVTIWLQLGACAKPSKDSPHSAVLPEHHISPTDQCRDV